MKRLLISLLAALALPTAVISGDLGSADLKNTILRTRIHYDQVDNESIFKIKCGSLLYAVKKCTVSFSEGRLKVDDSIGITPSQVLDIYENNPANFAHFYINYIDADGKINHAGFEIELGLKNKFIFKKALYKWMNSDK